MAAEDPTPDVPPRPMAYTLPASGTGAVVLFQRVPRLDTCSTCHNLTKTYYSELARGRRRIGGGRGPSGDKLHRSGRGLRARGEPSGAMDGPVLRRGRLLAA